VSFLAQSGWEYAGDYAGGAFSRGWSPSDATQYFAVPSQADLAALDIKALYNSPGGSYSTEPGYGAYDALAALLGGEPDTQKSYFYWSALTGYEQGEADCLIAVYYWRNWWRCQVWHAHTSGNKLPLGEEWVSDRAFEVGGTPDAVSVSWGNGRATARTNIFKIDGRGIMRFHGCLLCDNGNVDLQRIRE
jgi:hypothetical protein